MLCATSVGTFNVSKRQPASDIDSPPPIHWLNNTANLLYRMYVFHFDINTGHAPRVNSSTSLFQGNKFFVLFRRTMLVYLSFVQFLYLRILEMRRCTFPPMRAGLLIQRGNVC